MNSPCVSARCRDTTCFFVVVWFFFSSCHLVVLPSGPGIHGGSLRTKRKVPGAVGWCTASVVATVTGGHARRSQGSQQTAAKSLCSAIPADFGGGKLRQWYRPQKQVSRSCDDSCYDPTESIEKLCLAQDVMFCLFSLLPGAAPLWVCRLPLSRPSLLQSRCVTRGSRSCHWTAACCLSSCSFSICWWRCLSSTSTSTGRCGGTRTATQLPLPHW